MVELVKYQGEVIRGKREAKKIGFPTANIKVEEKIEPGIYAGFTSILEIGLKDLPSMFYIARNSQVIESHILDFQAMDLYGKEISVRLIQKLREIQRFSGLKEAKKQIKKDELEARKWFKRHQD